MSLEMGLIAGANDLFGAGAKAVRASSDEMSMGASSLWGSTRGKASGHINQALDLGESYGGLKTMNGGHLGGNNVPGGYAGAAENSVGSDKWITPSSYDPKAPLVAHGQLDSPSTNKGFGPNTILGVAGLAALGAGVGAGTAAMTDGNKTPGAIWGGAVGAGLGAMRGVGGISSLMRSIPMAGQAINQNVGRKIFAGVGGVGAGYALSGNRGQDKRSGFNGHRGNKISSGSY